MSDRASQNGHTPLDDTTDLDILTPAIETLHARLLDDGAIFRAGLPDVTLVTRRALLQVDPDEAIEAGDEPEGMLEISREPLRRVTRPAIAQPHRRIQRLTAVAAMLTIVGLLAALFVTLAPGRPGGRPTRLKPPVSKVTGSAWTLMPFPHIPSALDTAGGGYYVAAPGDPRVVYFIGVSVDAKTAAAAEVFARLDGGQQWVPLSFPLPSLAGVHAASATQMTIIPRLDVMPSDPLALILNLDVQGTTTCPIAQPIQYTCSEYLYSSDGGAHWRPLSLPASGLLAQWNVLDSGTMTQPYWDQDGWLYTTLSSADPGYHPYGTRIVVSSDNGTTWRYADGDLATKGQIIAEYLPATHGQSLYAVTQAIASDIVSRQLWRSDNRGANWVRAGSMPDQTVLSGVTALTHGGADSLYRDRQADPTQLSADPVPAETLLLTPEYSGDGGVTWQYIPLTGLPLDTGGTPYTVGTLADGSLIVVLPGKAWEQSGGNIAANLTFYAWKPWSASWRQLAPTVSNIQIGNTVIPSWWLIPDTSSSPARLCVFAESGGDSSSWGIQCSTLS